MMVGFVVGCKLPRNLHSGVPSLVSWHRLFIRYYPP